MELTEPIESINNQLRDQFGSDTITGLPMWRIVFSESQFEKRKGTYDDYTPGGIYLRTVTEVREVPKYSWIKERYVLERLVIVPEFQQNELPTSKLSYEPLWVFQTGSGVYLPPRFDASKLIIDSVLAAQYADHNLAKYKDPMAGLTTSEQIEKKAAEIDKLQEELFGNETFVGDAIAHKEAIIVPRNYEKRK
jgi:hypothetical protein